MSASVGEVGACGVDGAGASGCLAEFVDVDGDGVGGDQFVELVGELVELSGEVCGVVEVAGLFVALDGDGGDGVGVAAAGSDVVVASGWVAVGHELGECLVPAFVVVEDVLEGGDGVAEVFGVVAWVHLYKAFG